MFHKRTGVLGSILTAAAIAFAAGTTGAKAQDIPESPDPIKLALAEWTGQHITTYIAGQILEKMGYNVEYVTAAYLPSATAIADGNITGSLEVWDNNLGEFFPKLIEGGQIEDIGDTGLDAREGWLYPKHVEELCPGLPAWDAFLSCAEVFAVPETFPKGRFLEYPADWGDRATQLIVSEDLPFEAVPAGSEGALVAELNASIQKKSPLVMMFWAPHWVLSTTDVGWVDMPQDLVEKASMQKPRTFKVVWPGTKDKWPHAYKFLQAFQITNDVQEPLMDLIDNQGQDALEVTKRWVEDNQDVWQPFVDQAMM
jgi:glycine betaine/proline transport system substrate-binding protein